MMTQTILGIVIILVSIGIISVGVRYARTSKAAFAKAGVKVDTSHVWFCAWHYGSHHHYRWCCWTCMGSDDRLSILN